MPPRRGAKPQQPAAAAAAPLEGCVVAFSGRFRDKYDHSHDSLIKFVRSLGGAVAKTAAASMTHLVCTEPDYVDGTVKVRAAQEQHVPVVKPEWLFASPSAARGRNKKRPIAAVADSSADHDNTAVQASSPQAKKLKANGKASDEPPADEDKVVAEGQFVKKKGVAIPLDSYCPLTSYRVHVDPDTGMIYDASLNQSSTSNNHNKFYRLQVLRNPADGSFKTWTRWGRVGETGQNAVLGDGTIRDAIRSFEKKFRDKAGLPWDRRGEDPKPGKYAFVERSYNPDSDDDDDDDDDDDGSPSGAKNSAREGGEASVPECTLDKPVQQLMELIFNQSYFQAAMSSLNYDANKLPLGKLSKATITRGFQQLKDLAALLDDPSLALSRWDRSAHAATEHLSNTYYSVIPHAFGRNRPPLIGTHAQLKMEIELLESLSDMKAAAELLKVDRKAAEDVHPQDRQFRSLGMREMTALDPASREFALLERYLQGSRGSTHGVKYRVQHIFRIERQGEGARFEASRFASVPSDRRLLWHGSRATNFGGILSQGLRIAPPEAPVSGYMFGKGIYLADMSSKSANYCSARDSNGQALLLLCEAELGRPMQQLTQSSYDAGDDAAAKGMVSTCGIGDTGPSKWMDAGVVHPTLQGIHMPDMDVKPGPTNIPGTSLLYNEYICYDVAQVKLRYLFRVTM
ncbi:poly(ADP-ribose) polymerase catalytic domain-containing protein [Hirsutella rhossiliensis]|uniref:Poly [ADP-ribose] polymerase n=1 Tax=Hirsutella rhossiliensis TaxID=111463 RepID=A0A9P8SP93_9HYPO|nr:poly(ADP-ribose) polymerase catalytic domain-containing protein [Hirsutella rhossiliensis]KAH0967971.1 poly(ADP-ribose) polymerase catalytic domain-containing protein [Hirsutella rhossiliensis]